MRKNVVESHEELVRLQREILAKGEDRHHALVVPRQACTTDPGREICEELIQLRDSDIVAMSYRVLLDETIQCIIPSACENTEVQRDVNVEAMKVLRGGKHARVFIDGFEKLSVEKQANVLSAARATVRQKKQDGIEATYQLTVCGSFSRCKYETYCDASGGRMSRACNHDDYITLSYCNADDILRQAMRNELCGHDCEFIPQYIIRATGGDRELCDHIVRAIRRTGPEHIDDILRGLSSEADIYESVAARLEELSHDAISLAKTLCRTPYVAVRKSDEHAESLILQSIVKTVHCQGVNKKTIALLSPIVRHVLCRKFSADTNEVYVQNSDLLLSDHVPNVYAYEIVAEIENALRNFLCHAVEGNMKELRAVRISRSDMKRMADMCEEFTHKITRKRTIKTVQKECKALVKVIKQFLRGRVPLSDVAREWAQRQDRSVDLCSESLMAFLTTGDLKCCYECHAGALFNGLFGKHELVTLFDRFVPIRDAVAHNQQVSFRTVHRLREIHSELMERLGAYGAAIVSSPVERC